MKRPIATRIGTNDLDIYNEVVTQDCYGIKALSNKFKEKDVRVIDVGAHIGCFAYAITEYLIGLNSLTYYGLEPYSPNYSILRNNEEYLHEFSPYTKNLFMYARNVAVTSSRGHVRLESVDAFNTGMVVFKPCDKSDETVNSTGILKVINNSPVDILKLDCEGAEEQFFEEIPMHLVKNMVGEYHSYGFMRRLVEVFGDDANRNLEIIPSPHNKHQGIFRLFSI